jgi:hypothetical protein
MCEHGSRIALRVEQKSGSNFILKNQQLNQRFVSLWQIYLQILSSMLVAIVAGVWTCE